MPSLATLITRLSRWANQNPRNSGLAAKLPNFRNQRRLDFTGLGDAGGLRGAVAAGSLILPA